MDDRRVPILSPEWGGSHIAQRRKPWEHCAHHQPTAPDGATEFIRTSHSSAHYGAMQPKCCHDPQLRHWAMLAVAPFGALVASGFGGSAHTSTGLSMSGGLGSVKTPPPFFYSTFDIRHSTFDIRHSTFDIRHSTFHTNARNIGGDAAGVVCGWISCVNRNPARNRTPSLCSPRSQPLR